MANLNIRNLSEGDRQNIRVKAAKSGKSMESYVRDLALQDYYELRVERGGDREFVAMKGNMTEQEAYAAWDEWREDEDVTKLWLKVNGEFDLAWPCARHDIDESGRCERCREVAPKDGAIII